MDRSAREHPERIAILGEPVEVRYGELSEMVNRVGNALRSIGCAPGDRVLIVLPDSSEFVAAFFGAAKIGAVAVPVNPFTRRGDYAYYLADSTARIAIVHEVARAEFSTAVRKNPLEHIVVVGGGAGAQIEGGAKTHNWDEWLAIVSPRLEAHPTRPDDMAFFLYTSGSGGTPKGAIHQHKDMLYTTEGYAHDVLGLRPDDRTFSVSKLFFAYGLGNGMYFPFSVGAATVLNPERPKPERVAELIARYRPTIFFSVPTFYALLLREAEQGLKLDFSSVRLAVSAGESLPAELFERYRQKFGLEILDAIGSTEMLHMFIATRPGRAKAGSCGTEIAGYEAKIVDDAGAVLSRGEIGNLWVKGGAAFSGYWQKPELTERAKRGEWVVTGDKFFQDTDGDYHYCGRADDMLKVAGMWVSPGEVENTLLGHPAVAEAAVVGAKDEGGLVRVVAYVVLRNGEAAEPERAEEIRGFVRGRLPNYKVPQAVFIRQELPKTATGKIQRYRLRETSDNSFST